MNPECGAERCETLILLFRIQVTDQCKVCDKLACPAGKIHSTKESILWALAVNIAYLVLSIDNSSLVFVGQTFSPQIVHGSYTGTSMSRRRGKGTTEVLNKN